MGALNWSLLEDAALRQACGANKSRKKASEIVSAVLSVHRSEKSCMVRLQKLNRLLGLKLQFGARPSTSQRKSAVSKEAIGPAIDHSHRVKQDQRFQEAMFNAGMRMGTSSAPGTDAPIAIARPSAPVGGSSSGWGM